LGYEPVLDAQAQTSFRKANPAKSWLNSKIVQYQMFDITALVTTNFCALPNNKLGKLLQLLGSNMRSFVPLKRAKDQSRSNDVCFNVHASFLG
jgi:hypothetical protein